MIDFHCFKTHLLAGFYYTSRVKGVSPDVAAVGLIWSSFLFSLIANTTRQSKILAL